MVTSSLLTPPLRMATHGCSGEHPYTPNTSNLTPRLRMARRLVRVVQPVGDEAEAAEDSTLVRLRHASAAVNDADVLLSQAALKKLHFFSKTVPFSHINRSNPL